MKTKRVKTVTEERLRVPRVGVGIMILNEKGEVLMGRRHDDPEKAGSQLHGEGTWTVPGGKLDFGEDLVKGAAREAYEETGLRTRNLEVMSIGNEVVPDAHFVTIGFLCRDFDGQPKAMEPDEITEWKWFPLDGLPDAVFLPTLKMINNYKNKRILGE